ncbi:pentapeptide repeat-containing protein [Allocoleopsis sp.]|uniref:pentapeptide repeat-containing protein n=1 Tax=Allocoleopsis sp. TaxID=3088169 RepID=UPI002FD50DF2
MKSIGYFPKFLVGLFVILLVLMLPAWTATAATERSPLTLELLQERLKSPIQSEGVRTIDLRQLIINLRSDNAEFRDQFYQLLQTQLNRSETPLGIDLSHSLIEGELIGSKLGLRTPLHGEALSPLLTPDEQQQLLRDPRRLSQPTLIPTVTVFRGAIKLVQTRVIGTVNFANTFFLNRVEANGAVFTQESDWSETRWTRSVDFADTAFGREANFSGSLFSTKATFARAQFRGVANFQGSTFEGNAIFSHAQFAQLANFTRSVFGSANSFTVDNSTSDEHSSQTRSAESSSAGLRPATLSLSLLAVRQAQSHIQEFADFTHTNWRDRALFSKTRFLEPLFLTEASFEKSVAFRETQFNQPVNLRSVSLLEQVDFSNARFLNDVYLNVASLTFDSDQAKIIGDTGRIGRVLSVPVLEGNEDVLRNLVRNFRSLQQIADANQLEYTTQRLRLRQLGRDLLGKDSQEKEQEDPSIHLIAFPHPSVPASSSTSSPLGWVLDALSCVGLSLLLLLSRYGTSFWLIFGVGLVAIAYFGLLFWLVDRFRRRHPQPIVPTVFETPWMLGSYGVLTFAGVTAIFRTSDRPWLTLACLGVVILPIPMLLLWRLYQQGRYHDLMDVSYFVEDGSLRQLRLLIGRLPVMPRFEMFRDRYMPILWDCRWNWLNYYDFSLNNLLKLGFNDIRLRDKHLPGIISTLVWYQWSLGILYIALLFWTLSRTIPGLNLLIYLK